MGLSRSRGALAAAALLCISAGAAYAPSRRAKPLRAALRAAPAESAAIAVVRDDDAAWAPLAIGASTACLGLAYKRCLVALLVALWRGVPAAAPGAGPWLVPAITGCGGAFVAAVFAARPGGVFGVGAFVAAGRGAAPWPSPADALPRLLAASLLSTAFGFSVGPEAPMVAAGGVVGAALARRCGRGERAGALAGASGALTAFLGFPVAGAVFAHEILTPSAGLAGGGVSSSVLATVGASLACAALAGGSVGGHFSWGGAAAAVPAARGYATAVALGVGGALVGGALVGAVRFLERALGGRRGSRVLAGLAVGAIALRYPQALFWGEQSLQAAIDGRADPAALLLPVALQGGGGAAGIGVGVGVAKLASIALAVAGGFPGGVIFPLFFAAGGLVRGAAAGPPAVACAMAALQASVTRTPLATALMLAMSAADFGALAPLAAVAAYVGVWTARGLRLPTLFEYPGAAPA